MINLEQKATFSKWEIPFQVGITVIVFIFYAYRGNPGDMHVEVPLSQSHFVFFSNYVLGGLVMSYYLFPKFLYKKKYWHFFGSVVILISIVIVLEEAVIEKIYFPEFRGRYFQGVFRSLIDVLPVMIILCGFKLAWDIILKERQVDQLKDSVKESELKFLKSQINPHFLFNNLNNLYSHALENSPKTPQIIIEMSSILRYMLYECRQEYVSIANEVKQLEHFIGLYEMQIEGRGSVSFNKQGIENTNKRIAPLVLMVFVENAFKHSSNNQMEGIKIEISMRLENDSLYFDCYNTFEEGSTEVQSEDSGIGLENVKKRLAYIYPNAHELTIDKSDKEFRVSLKIELSDH